MSQLNPWSSKLQQTCYISGELYWSNIVQFTPTCNIKDPSNIPNCSRWYMYGLLPSLTVLHQMIIINNNYHQYTRPNCKLPSWKCVPSGENKFWWATNHIASALLLIGQQGLVRSSSTNHMSLRKPFKDAHIFHGDST